MTDPMDLCPGDPGLLVSQPMKGGRLYGMIIPRESADETPHTLVVAVTRGKMFAYIEDK